MDKNFVRIGKWFVRPYDKDEKPVNKRSVFRVPLLFASSSLTTPVFALRSKGFVYLSLHVVLGHCAITYCMLVVEY